VLEALVALPSGRNRDQPPLAPGSRGRTLQVQYACQFLTFAVDQCGAADRWRPPADTRLLVGIAPKGKELTTPIRDDQVVRLLAGITNPQWRTAVGLVACFGLRGVELGYIRANGRHLHCSYRKRTARQPEGTPPRNITGLDPAGLEGLSANLLAQLAERGEDALPPAVLRVDANGERTGAGQALQQFLNRQAVWRELVAEVAAMPAVGSTGNELVPYSLRHGYAMRSVQSYGETTRVTAQWMGHSLQTHHAIYGGAVDQPTLLEAADRVDAVIASRRLEALV